MKAFMYYLALVLGAPLALLFFKTKVTYEGGKKFAIPKGALIIAGHKSPLDAISIAYLFFFRRLYFLAADWYHGFLRIFKPLMAMTGAVFVDLKGERFDFVSRSRALLTSGKSLLVFPEGDYVKNKRLHELGEFKTGYLLIALESGAPIVPVSSDFSYGFFRRLHLKIGKPIYLPKEITPSSREELAELNGEIKKKCLRLLYELKREKAAKVKMHYDYKEPRKGDVIRVGIGSYHHYGVYLGDERVIEFGRAVNQPGEAIDVHLTSLLHFSGGRIPEVRVLAHEGQARPLGEIEDYAREVLGQEDYSLAMNNCLDLANRLTLDI